MQTKRITAKPRPRVKREPKETNLRRLARDRECQIRIPGVCNGDSATTVVLKLWHFEGMTRTQQTLIDEGVIRV